MALRALRTAVILLVVSAILKSSKIPRQSDHQIELKKIFTALSNAERKLLFGDTQDPKFEIIPDPTWKSLPNGQQRLSFQSDTLHVDIVVSASGDFLAALDQSSSVSSCHWRFLNESSLVVIFSCLQNGLHAMIIDHGTQYLLYPLAKNFIEATMYAGMPRPHIFYKAGGPSISQATSGDPKEREYSALPITPKTQSEENITLETELDNSTEVVDLENDLEKFKVLNRSDWSDRNTLDSPLRKTIEIGVFCDRFLYDNFHSKSNEEGGISLVDYIYILINALEGIFHQEELGGYQIDLKLVRISLLKDGGPGSHGGDIGLYLEEFCNWQSSRNPRNDTDPLHWDHAIMLSGLPLQSKKNRGVIGLAWIDGMCLRTFSCTIVEGGTYLSLYIAAHEIGHSLGMEHDGVRSFSKCDSNAFIMSPSVEDGKMSWSECSARFIHTVLRRPSCLDDNVRTELSSSSTNATSEDGTSEGVA